MEKHNVEEYNVQKNADARSFNTNVGRLIATLSEKQGTNYYQNIADGYRKHHDYIPNVEQYLNDLLKSLENIPNPVDEIEMEYITLKDDAENFIRVMEICKDNHSYGLANKEDEMSRLLSYIKLKEIEKMIAFLETLLQTNYIFNNNDFTDDEKPLLRTFIAELRLQLHNNLSNSNISLLKAQYFKHFMDIILSLNPEPEKLIKAINIIKSEITPRVERERTNVVAEFSARTVVPFTPFDKPIIDENVLSKLNLFITNLSNVDVAKNLNDNLTNQFIFNDTIYNGIIEIIGFNDILDYANYLKDKTETETKRAYISNLELEIKEFLKKITPFTLGPVSPDTKYDIALFVLHNKKMQKWKASKEAAAVAAEATEEEAASESNSRGGKRRKSKRITIKRRKSKRITIKRRKSKIMKKRKYK